MPQSGQNPNGSSKAAKFAAANPLGPMADPFSGMDDDSKEYHKAVSENVNDRMTKAMGELKEKHERGTNELDDPDRAPTGAAYREAHSAQMDRQRASRAAAAEEERRKEDEAREVQRLREEVRRKNFGGGDDSDDDSDDEYDHLLDEDPEIESIRARRIAEMRAAQEKKAEDMARGHGQLRTIGQDEFLPECTGSSEWVAVHFYSDDFERCKVMDHHLKLVAPLHTECKFLRMDAMKAPFFASKLKIRTLPALLVFRDGKAIDRLTGFEGLAINPAEPDKWHTGRLRTWIAATGAIQYKEPDEEVREEMKRLGILGRGAVWGDSEGYDEDE